jgi:hypothetical protein
VSLGVEPNPYAPPQALEPRPLEASGVRDPALARSLASTRRVGVAMRATIGLRVGLGWAVRAIDLAYMASARVRGSWITDTERSLASLSGLVGLLGIVLFLVWIYQAARNVRALGFEGTMSPGMCVASFFIPVASLYLPYKAMFEISAASNPEGEGRAPIFVLMWWLLFLAQNVLTLTRSFLFGLHADMETRVALDVAASALGTGAVVALFLTVRFIGRGQEHWARQ